MASSCDQPARMVLTLDTRRIRREPYRIFGVIGDRTVNIFCLRCLQSRGVSGTDSSLICGMRLRGRFPLTACDQETNTYSY